MLLSCTEVAACVKVFLYIKGPGRKNELKKTDLWNKEKDLERKSV